MTRGVTLLAIGSTAYGYWAYNMALSLKCTTDLKIQLLHDHKALKGLNGQQLSMFDIKTPMHYEHCYRKKLEPGLAKIHMYDYLAFDETIYLDVDGVCVKDITPLFDLKVDYATQVYDEVRQGDGVHKNMRWQEAGEIWRKFKLKKTAVLPATNTSFQLIRKGKHAAKVFADAQAAIANSWDYKELALQWGRTHAQPDELYMNISLAKNGFVKVGEPILFTLPQTKRMTLDEVKDKFYVIGYWGDKHLNAKWVRVLYDQIMKQYSKQYLNFHQQFKFNHLINRKFLLRNV